jgi:hypothetical protein
MNIYEKAVLQLHNEGLRSAHIAGGEGDVGVFVDVWNAEELDYPLVLRLHDEEINYYSNQYDKNNETK